MTELQDPRSMPEPRHWRITSAHVSDGYVTRVESALDSGDSYAVRTATPPRDLLVRALADAVEYIEHADGEGGPIVGCPRRTAPSPWDDGIMSYDEAKDIAQPKTADIRPASGPTASALCEQIRVDIQHAGACAADSECSRGEIQAQLADALKALASLRALLGV